MIDVDEDGTLGDVPVMLLAAYLKTHRRLPLFTERWEFGPQGDTGPRPPAPVLEFLIHVPEASCWYVRWPNGMCKWESTASLLTRGFHPPARPLLTPDMDVVEAALLEVDGVQTVSEREY